MSSRLMNMKFMQRAAAANAVSAPSSDTFLDFESNPPPKRRKKEVPQAPHSMAQDHNAQLITPAPDKEEVKRERAIDRIAEEAGETKWVLSQPIMRTDTMSRGENVRFLVVGADPSQDHSQSTVGRRRFGALNGNAQASANDEADESASEDSRSPVSQYRFSQNAEKSVASSSTDRQELNNNSRHSDSTANRRPKVRKVKSLSSAKNKIEKKAPSVP